DHRPGSQQYLYRLEQPWAVPGGTRSPLSTSHCGNEPMNRFACLSLFSIAASVAGCADPNTVLFVTNSSLGINFDSKPPTANIAYDRTEGFVGPRFPNGAAPPAVASIETGGNIFEPKVRQVYATGHAAVRATKGPDAPEGPTTLESDDNNKRKLMFFGTETTVGIKVGFGTNTLPHTLLCGYRRKEASVIPLGEIKENGKTTAVYPSVLASIDMNTNTTSPNEAGITSKQFFATGQAAVALANNEAVAAAFRARAIESAKSGLTAEQIRAAEIAGVASANVTRMQFNKIADFISNPDGTLNKAKLMQMATDANAQSPRAVPANLVERLKTDQTVDAVRRRVEPYELTVK